MRFIKLNWFVLKGVSKVWYHGILKDTVSGVFEDLKFRISEGSHQPQLTETANRAESGRL